MSEKEQCKLLERVAYKSCLYSFLNNKDKEDIIQYKNQLIKEGKYCQSNGVEKALELIKIYEDLDLNA